MSAPEGQLKLLAIIGAFVAGLITSCNDYTRI